VANEYEHHYVPPLRKARVVALKAYFARANEMRAMFAMIEEFPVSPGTRSQILEQRLAENEAHDSGSRQILRMDRRRSP
jgi:hypothetical protein